jgi:hypothetical protein
MVVSAQVKLPLQLFVGFLSNFPAPNVIDLVSTFIRQVLVYLGPMLLYVLTSHELQKLNYLLLALLRIQHVSYCL